MYRHIFVIINNHTVYSHRSEGSTFSWSDYLRRGCCNDWHTELY